MTSHQTLLFMTDVTSPPLTHITTIGYKHKYKNFYNSNYTMKYITCPTEEPYMTAAFSPKMYNPLSLFTKLPISPPGHRTVTDSLI